MHDDTDMAVDFLWAAQLKPFACLRVAVKGDAPQRPTGRWTELPPAPADGHATPAAGPAAAPAPPTPAQGAGGPLKLHPLRSCKGHGDLVFGLAVDARHRQAVSGGKDPYLQVRRAPGVLRYYDKEIITSLLFH